MKTSTASGDNPSQESSTSGKFYDDSATRPDVSAIIEAGSKPTPYLNMYSTDDDDEEVLDMCSRTSPQHDLPQESDEDSVRSVHVTNPWSLAKVNAKIGPSMQEPRARNRLSPGNRIITPERGTDDQVPGLSKGLHPYTVKYPGLPSPATSSVSSPSYQNPGPPLRPWGPRVRARQDLDDIQFTQGNCKTDHPALRRNGSETWSTSLNSNASLLSFKKASELYKGYGLISNSSLDIGRHSPKTPGNFQQFDHVAEAKDLESSSATCHGNDSNTLASSSRSKQVSSPWYNVQRLGPGLAPEASQERFCTPMPSLASPAQRCSKTLQAQEVELAGILDFEHRKKAVMAQQRQISKNLTNKLNPPVLANLSAQSPERSETAPRFVGTKRMVPRTDIENNRDCEPRGEAIDYDLVATAPYSSPHEKRHLAGKKLLSLTDQDGEGTRESRRSPLDGKSGESGHDLQTGDEAFKWSEDDPRAYLINRRAHSSKADSSIGFTKTGLRVRRTRTGRLPLECVPVEANLHSLSAHAVNHFPEQPPLRNLCVRLAGNDEYLRTGQIEPLKWSANSKAFGGMGNFC